MSHSTTTTQETLALAREQQAHALHELRLAFRCAIDEEPTIDGLDCLRGAIAEYVTAARMLEKCEQRQVKSEGGL